MLLEPVYSTVDFGFYRRVVENGIGRSIGYVAYLGLVFACVSSVALFVRLSPIIEKTSEWAAQTFPAITIQGGKATSSAQGPVLVRHPEAQEFGVLIDTGRTTPLTMDELSQQKIWAALTQSSLYIVLRPGEMRQFDLSRNPSDEPIKLEADGYRRIGSLFSRVLYPVAWIATWIFFFIWKGIASLFYGLIGLGVNSIQGAGLEFDSLFKIAVYAQTPSVLLQMIAGFFPRPVPGLTLISFALVLFYMWKGIAATKATGPDAA